MRSPFAERCLRKILDEIGVRNVEVSSAGTLGIAGSPADAAACTIALERGFDLQPHRSRGLTDRQLARADLIVVMEKAHKLRVEEIDAAAAGRTRLVREYERDGSIPSVPDLEDPIGARREDIVRCFEILETCV